MGADFMELLSTKNSLSTKKLCKKWLPAKITCNGYYPDWRPHEFCSAHKFAKQYFLLNSFMKVGPDNKHSSCPCLVSCVQALAS